MSMYMMCANNDLPSSKISPKWHDKSATCQVLKTSNMPNGRKLALSSTLIYIYIYIYIYIWIWITFK
jgi:hypothetical protein